ncbi:hypothetical protein ACTXT7_007386 [Hymenolepis weldensis]
MFVKCNFKDGTGSTMPASQYGKFELSLRIVVFETIEDAVPVHGNLRDGVHGAGGVAVLLGLPVLKDLEFPEPTDFKAVKLESYSCQSLRRKVIGDGGPGVGIGPGVNGFRYLGAGYFGACGGEYPVFEIPMVKTTERVVGAPRSGVDVSSPSRRSWGPKCGGVIGPESEEAVEPEVETLAMAELAELEDPNRSCWSGAPEGGVL